MSQIESIDSFLLSSSDSDVVDSTWLGLGSHTLLEATQFHFGGYDTLDYPQT